MDGWMELYRGWGLWPWCPVECNQTYFNTFTYLKQKETGIVFSSSSSSGLITEHEPHRLCLILYTLAVDSVMKPHSCVLQHVRFALLRYVRACVCLRESVSVQLLKALFFHLITSWLKNRLMAPKSNFYFPFCASKHHREVIPYVIRCNSALEWDCSEETL